MDRHYWDDPPVGIKRRCMTCGIVDGGSRRTRDNPDDPTPPCRHPKGHNWVPVMRTMDRRCTRCEMVLPLKGDGLARAKRVELMGTMQGWRCYYCRIPFGPTALPTEDHRVPRSRGGWRVLRNLVLACGTCNNWKGDGTEYDLRRMPKFKQREKAVARGRLTAAPH